MDKVDWNKVLQEFFDFKEFETPSQQPFAEKLRSLCQKDTDSHEIMHEFEGEWRKEKLDREKGKRAKFSIWLGILIFSYLVFAYILMAFLKIKTDRVFFQGLALGGASLLIVEGFTTIRRINRDRKRRETKWKNW